MSHPEDVLVICFPVVIFVFRMEETMNKVFTTLKIKDMSLKNRIVMAPMCMYSAQMDAIATEWHRVHYATRALGDVGLIMTEAVAVLPEGRISDQDLGLWNDNQREKLRAIVTAVQNLGSKIGIQLAHAGRKSRSSSLPHIGASTRALNDEYVAPEKLDPSSYDLMAEAWKKAAKRAHEAGFDLIEIHGGHGYLISEFLSPFTHPEDDLDNRFELLSKIVKSIRQVWPTEKPLQIRLSATDYLEEGLSKRDLIEIVRRLKKLDVDVINVSSGGVDQADIPIYPGYQVPWSDFIKKHVDIITIAGGLISDVNMVTEILENDRADLVYLGRELLRNPFFVHDYSASRRIHEEIVPEQYQRAYR